MAEQDDKSAEINQETPGSSSPGSLAPEPAIPKSTTPESATTGTPQASSNASDGIAPNPSVEESEPEGSNTKKRDESIDTVEEANKATAEKAKENQPPAASAVVVDKKPNIFQRIMRKIAAALSRFRDGRKAQANEGANKPEKPKSIGVGVGGGGGGSSQLNENEPEAGRNQNQQLLTQTVNDIGSRTRKSIQAYSSESSELKTQLANLVGTPAGSITPEDKLAGLMSLQGEATKLRDGIHLAAKDFHKEIDVAERMLSTPEEINDLDKLVAPYGQEFDQEKSAIDALLNEVLSHRESLEQEVKMEAQNQQLETLMSPTMEGLKAPLGPDSDLLVRAQDDAMALTQMNDRQLSGFESSEPMGDVAHQVKLIESVLPDVVERMAASEVYQQALMKSIETLTKMPTEDMANQQPIIDLEHELTYRMEALRLEAELEDQVQEQNAAQVAEADHNEQRTADQDDLDTFINSSPDNLGR